MPISSNTSAPPVAAPRASRALPSHPDVAFIRAGLTFWFNHLPAGERASLEAQWSALHRSEVAARSGNGHSTEPVTHASLIFGLLRRISETAHADAYRDTAVALLQAAATDEAFRATCGAQALVADADCHENAINRLEALRLELTFRTATGVESFVEAATAKAVTDLLFEFTAREFRARSEALEVFQHLKVELGSHWGLPESHMLYGDFAVQYLGGPVKAAALVDRAAKYVDAHLQDQIVKTLMDVPRWQVHLQANYRAELDECLDAVHQALARVMESDELTERTEPRIDGLRNIFCNKQALALQRLTRLCVQEARDADANHVDVHTRVEDRVRQPGHARDVEVLVRNRLAADADFQRISEAAAAQAEQWEQPTLFLAEHHWGRAAGNIDPGRRSDPMGDRFRSQQRQAQAAAQPEPGTDLRLDQEALDLQRALEESLRVAARSSRSETESERAPAAMRGVVETPGGVVRNAALARAMHALDQALWPQAGRAATVESNAPILDVMRDLEEAFERLPAADRARAARHVSATPAAAGSAARQATPGLDRITLASGEVDRNMRPSLVPDPPYMVDASHLRGLLKGTQGIFDNAQRTLALHGDAALMDVIRARLKSHFRSGEAVLATLAGRDGPGTRTPLQIIAQLVSASSGDQGLRIARARLATSMVDLLRRLAASLAQVSGGDWSHGRARVLTALSGDRRLFTNSPTHAVAAPPRGLELQLHASGFDVSRPLPNLQEVLGLEAQADRMLRGIDDPALRRAYRSTSDLAHTAERLDHVMRDYVRTASTPR